jgi:hypothetical protein
MTVDLGELNDLWLLACDDAGFESNAEAALYVVEGNAGEGSSAIHIEPGSEVGADREWPLEANQVVDANSPERQNSHRIAVRDFSSRRVALGRLRHELEHAKQYERSAPLYRRMGATRYALAREFELQTPPSRKCSAVLYTLLPFEEDANRAAAHLTNRHFGPASAAELQSTDAPLFRDDSPIQADTLALRVLAFAALFPVGMAWVAEQNEESLTELLGHLGSDAAAGWTLLSSTAEISEYGRRALSCCPTEAEIDSSPTPTAAWQPVKELIQEGRIAAEAVLKAHEPALRLH